MSNVTELRAISRELKGGGGPPDNGGMEARVAKLEESAQQTRDRLTRIEARLDSFPSVFATKEDLHRELHSATWKFITWTTTIGAALVAAVYFIARNVH